MKTYRQYLLENNDETKFVSSQEMFVDTKEALQDDGWLLRQNCIKIPKGTEYWLDSAGLLSREDGPAAYYKKGRSYLEVWCRHGDFHRLGDLPAYQKGTRTKQWWINGLRHRDHDLPAVKYESGYSLESHYYKHGIRYVPGRKEKVELVDGKLAIKRVDGTIIFRQQNDLRSGNINSDTERIIRPDGSIEKYKDGLLVEIQSHNEKNYNFIINQNQWDSIDFCWKNKKIFFRPGYGYFETNFSKDTYAKFFLQLGEDKFLEYFQGYHLGDEIKWKMIKQDIEKASDTIKDFNREQQKYIIEQRPDLIHKIHNLDKDLKEKYSHEIVLAGVDI